MLHRRGHPTPTRCFRGLEPPPRCSFFPLAWLPLLGFPVGIRLSFRPSVPASPLPPAPSQLHVLQAARTPPAAGGLRPPVRPPPEARGTRFDRSVIVAHRHRYWHGQNEGRKVGIATSSCGIAGWSPLEGRGEEDQEQHRAAHASQHGTSLVVLERALDELAGAGCSPHAPCFSLPTLRSVEKSRLASPKRKCPEPRARRT